MADTTGQVPAIPDELVDIIATALAQWDFEYAASHSIAGYRRWDELVGEDREHYRGAARSALAALDAASRVVVDLPKPDGEPDTLGQWYVDAPPHDVIVDGIVDNDEPVVALEFRDKRQFRAWSPSKARFLATVLLAAADEADRRADEFNASRQDAEDALDAQERLRSRTASAPEGGGDDAA